MKSMMKKSTLREIRQSFGRFIAILAIIALGVGFYAGLTVTKPTMLHTTQQYLSDHTFFDYRLLSTLGLEEKDIEAFRSQPDVKAAEGAYSMDMLYINPAGNEAVLKLHSLPEKINTLLVTKGRLPKTADECVVDSNLYSEKDIGTTLVISDNNESDTLEHLTKREFRIVGLVQSPYYMNFERGTTSLGSGKLAGFAYLSKDAFDMEYYTEAFVSFDQNAPLYSDEYDSYMDEKKDIWEALLTERAMLRFDSIKADANKELLDARKELNDQKSEAKTKLSEAEAELLDAKKQIEDGQKQLDDGKKELAQKEADWKAASAEYEQTLQQMIQIQGQMLPEAVAAQLEAARVQLEEGKKQISSARKELEQRQTELDDARLEWEDGQTEYEESKAEFDEKIADAETKLEDAQKEIDDLEEPDKYLLGRETNIGYACFNSDSSIVAGIARVFPVFFFLVAALVCITTMNRMVEEQRTQIGVLKALGYDSKAIIGKYMFYSTSAAVAGCLIGFFLGTYGFPRVIWTAYGIMYSLVPLEYIFSPLLLMISIVVSLLCSMGTTWFSCRYELSEVAAQLMRPKSPKAGKRVFLERIPFLWKHLKFLHKVSVRNIFRYKKRFFMMIVGISGCTALLVTGFGIKDSIADIADFQYGEIMQFDADAAFTEPVSKDVLADFLQKKDDTTEYLYTAEKAMDVKQDGLIKAVNLVVAKQEERLPEFVDFHGKKGEPIQLPKKGEAIINTKLANTFKIKTGDMVTLQDSDMKTLQVKVIGIFENYIYNYVYVGEETYTEQMGEAPEYKSAYLKFGENQNVHEESAALMKLEEVASVSVNEDMKNRIGNMMSSLDYIVVTIIICAGFLAFIVLYNLTNINITERIREIATIKVLGFYRRETSQYVFRENMLLTGIGALLGLLLGRLLHAFVMSQINIDMIAFDVRIRPTSYCMSILLTFLFAWVVNRVMAVKIDRINMAESLKSVD